MYSPVRATEFRCGPSATPFPANHEPSDPSTTNPATRAPRTQRPDHHAPSDQTTT
jgi:hypothetical protein